MLSDLVKFYFLLLLFVSLCLSKESISYFTSVKKLRELAVIDSHLFLNINVASNGHEDKIFREKLSLWSDEVARINRNPKKYVGNPLDAFKLIRRNVIEIAYFKNIFPSLMENIKENGTILPTKLDLIGAVKGLARLQKFYKLKTHEFANGVINGVVTDSKLSSSDMVTISNQLKGLGNWENKLSREYHELSKNSSYVSSDDIFDESFTKSKTYSEEHEKIFMQQICRGEIKKNPAEQSKLHCNYRSTNAFTKLAPFKVEVVNNEPLVFILIDVLSVKEMEDIMKIYRESNSTEDSTVGRPFGRVLDHNVRVAAMDKLQEEKYDIFQRITRRFDVSHAILETLILNSNLP